MIDITNGGKAAEKTAVALGYFDGLHLGHVGVISAAMAQPGLKPAVFTFNCDTTLPKFRGPEDIISFENKCELMEKIGVKYIYAPDFAEVCTLTDEEFVKGRKRHSRPPGGDRSKIRNARRGGTRRLS